MRVMSALIMRWIGGMSIISYITNVINSIGRGGQSRAKGMQIVIGFYPITTPADLGKITCLSAQILMRKPLLVI